MSLLVGTHRALLSRASGEPPAARAERWGLVSAWNLEDLTDSFGANTLTNNGVATFVAGKVGNAVNLVAASTQYLSRPDNASLSSGDVDLAISCWVKLATATGVKGFMGKWGAAGGREYTLWSLDGTSLIFSVSNDGTARVDASATVTLDTVTWYHLLGWHDAAGNTINVQVNQGTPVTVAHTTGMLDTAGAFEIGRVSSSNPLNGMVDAAYLFKSPPGGIASIIGELGVYLYNGGAGRSYPLDWAA